MPESRIRYVRCLVTCITLTSTLSGSLLVTAPSATVTCMITFTSLVLATESLPSRCLLKYRLYWNILWPPTLLRHNQLTRKPTDRAYLDQYNSAKVLLWSSLTRVKMCLLLLCSWLLIFIDIIFDITFCVKIHSFRALFICATFILFFVVVVF